MNQWDVELETVSAGDPVRGSRSRLGIARITTLLNVNWYSRAVDELLGNHGA